MFSLNSILSYLRDGIGLLLNLPSNDPPRRNRRGGRCPGSRPGSRVGSRTGGAAGMVFGGQRTIPSCQRVSACRQRKAAAPLSLNDFLDDYLSTTNNSTKGIEMLCLSVKEECRVAVGNIIVVVREARGGVAKLGFEGPRGIPIVREDAVNKAAKDGTLAELEAEFDYQDANNNDTNGN